MILASDVTKQFGNGGNGVTALDNVSLTINEGEFVSLLGPSGCGKSTFLRCLAGIETATSGRLLIDGQPIAGPPDRLGMAFQRDALLDWFDVLENVLLPADFGGKRKRDYEPRARELLAMAGLSAFMHSYPRALSGGMRQRVALCRSLLLDPRLLLMDEPFGALDALTRLKMHTLLRQLCERHRPAVLLVTHDVDEAIVLADRVIVLDGGVVRCDVRVELGSRRDPADPRFADLRRLLLTELGLDLTEDGLVDDLDSPDVVERAAS